MLPTSQITYALTTDKPYRIHYPYWLIAPILTLFFSSWVVLSGAGETALHSHYWQSQVDVFLWLNTQIMPIIPREIWGNFSMLGDTLVLLLVLSPLLLFRPLVWLTMLAAAPAAGILSALGKRLLAMPRPGTVLDAEQFQVIGDYLSASNSLPSGHTITVFTGLMVLVIGLCPRVSQPKHAMFILAGISLATLLGLSRVAVGAHWPLDIAFGAVLGWVAALCGIFWVNRCPRGWYSLLSDNALLVIIGLLYIGAFMLFLRAYLGVSSGWQILVFAGMCGLSVASLLLVKQLIAFDDDTVNRTIDHTRGAN